MPFKETRDLIWRYSLRLFQNTIIVPVTFLVILVQIVHHFQPTFSASSESGKFKILPKTISSFYLILLICGTYVSTKSLYLWEKIRIGRKLMKYPKTLSSRTFFLTYAFNVFSIFFVLRRGIKKHFKIFCNMLKKSWLLHVEKIRWTGWKESTWL